MMEYAAKEADKGAKFASGLNFCSRSGISSRHSGRQIGTLPLFYRLDIANLLNIQVSDALRHKEATSKRKAWATV